jgi:hypothetical protein
LTSGARCRSRRRTARRSAPVTYHTINRRLAEIAGPRAHTDPDQLQLLNLAILGARATVDSFDFGDLEADQGA